VCVFVRARGGNTDGNDMSVNEGCNLSPKNEELFIHYLRLASICSYIKWKFLHCSMSYFQNTSYHVCKGDTVWISTPYTF